jgi:2-desacetyl-2-hydroxyethyl bacteriochlorophyllide A dehydrogenase
VRTAVLQAPRSFELLEAPVPDVEPDDVLVRVAACGVCASELDMWEGRTDRGFPILPGHEVSGVVERVGADVSTVRKGDRVAVWVTERGFSEYVAVKAAFCLPAGGVPLELALAEPLACAVNAVEAADVRLGDDVLVIGAGFMGSLVVRLVALRGPRRLIVADAREEALERARRSGATHTIDVRRESVVDVVRSLTDGAPPGTHGDVAPEDELGADVAFEITGAQAPLHEVGDATRMSGKLVIVGYHQGGTREVPLAAWNWKALEVVNAHFRRVSTIMHGMRTGMRLLTAGRIRMDDLVTHRFGLDDVDRAFAAAHEKPDGFVKSTVIVGGG